MYGVVKNDKAEKVWSYDSLGERWTVKEGTVKILDSKGEVIFAYQLKRGDRVS